MLGTTLYVQAFDADLKLLTWNESSKLSSMKSTILLQYVAFLSHGEFKIVLLFKSNLFLEVKPSFTD